MVAQYNADHVGSLLRPTELLQAREAQSQGRLDMEQLREVEDRAVLEALEVQQHGQGWKFSPMANTGATPFSADRPNG